MSIAKKSHKTLLVIFLELLSLSPIFMILGNIIPAFPLKVHFITFGLSFLLVCLFLIQFQSKKWIIYTAFIYFILQFLLSGFHLKDFVDFFFGPFVFITLIDLLFNQRVSKATLWKYQKRFFILMWIPMIISFLQFLDILPLTFWNATYINYSDVEGVKTPRVNGFLYHGSELSVIIFFVAVKQLIRKRKYFLPISLFILIIAYITYYKALTLTVLMLIVYYYSVIDPLKIFRWTQRFFKQEKKLYRLLFLITIIGVLFIIYKIQIQGVKELFPPELLTGRGAIWNVYLQAIKDFSAIEWLFGAGIGSEQALFEKYATPGLFFPLKVDPNSDLTPDGHNTLLTLILNAGIAGIVLYFLLHKMLYSKIAHNTSLKNLILPLFFMYLLPIGVTITLYKKAVLWIALGFIVHYWWIKTYKIDHDEK